VYSGRGHGDRIGESDHRFRADERDRLHLLGDSYKYVWDQRCIGGIELGDPSGASVELHLDRTLGRRTEYGLIQLHGDAQRILQRDGYRDAIGRGAIDTGCADVQRLIGGTDIHYHAHLRGSGYSDADERRLAYESGGAGLCDASLGTGHWRRDGGKWIGSGEFHGAGVDRRVGDYHVSGDLQSGRVDRDRIDEPDRGFRADERHGVHLLCDGDKYVWDQRCIGGIELADASGPRFELQLYGAGGRRTECGIVQLHRYAQRTL